MPGKVRIRDQRPFPPIGGIEFPKTRTPLEARSNKPAGFSTSKDFEFIEKQLERARKEGVVARSFALRVVEEKAAILLYVDPANRRAISRALDEYKECIDRSLKFRQEKSPSTGVLNAMSRFVAEKKARLGI